MEVIFCWGMLITIAWFGVETFIESPPPPYFVLFMVLLFAMAAWCAWPVKRQRGDVW